LTDRRQKLFHDEEGNLLWKPRKEQLEAWRYLQAGGKHCEIVWHRRFGKDELCYRWTSRAVLERVGNYWHMLPLQTQARKALWLAVNPHTGKRRIDESFPEYIRDGKPNETEMLIRFKNGSTWQVIGSDNFNSLVGSPPVGLVFSEWALCDPAAWAYLMPILEENKGWVIFNTTPRGRNHAYRSVMSAIKDPDKFGQILPADQTDVFDTNQLDKIRQDLTDVYGDEYGLSVFDQEYMTSFESANIGAILGRALVRAEKDGRINNRHDYDELGAPIEISSDIGRRDASTWWFWQPCPGGFRIVDYLKDSGMDADEWCERLGAKISERGYKLGKIHLPHDARAKTFSAKYSAIEIFLNYFGARVMNIVPNSSKSNRINAARRVIKYTSFHRDKTDKGRDGLVNWSYVYDEERREFSKEPDHNWASHDGDGFSYGALIMEETKPDISEPKPVKQIGIGNQNTATLNDLWNTAPKKTWRI